RNEVSAGQGRRPDTVSDGRAPSGERDLETRKEDGRVLVFPWGHVRGGTTGAGQSSKAAHHPGLSIPSRPVASGACGNRVAKRTSKPSGSAIVKSRSPYRRSPGGTMTRGLSSVARRQIRSTSGTITRRL